MDLKVTEIPKFFHGNAVPLISPIDRIKSAAREVRFKDPKTFFG